MKCSEALRLLNRYVDGELPAAPCRQMDEHLANCAACHHELMEHRRLAGSIHQAMAEQPAPAGFEDAVLRRIENSRPRRVRGAAKTPTPRRPFSVAGFFEDVARAFGVVGEWFRDFRNWRL